MAGRMSARPMGQRESFGEGRQMSSKMWPKSGLHLLGYRRPALLPPYVWRALRVVRGLYVGATIPLVLVAYPLVMSAFGVRHYPGSDWIAIGTINPKLLAVTLLICPALQFLLYLFAGRIVSKLAARVQRKGGLCCVHCGYDLRMLGPSQNCPECGLEFCADETKERWLLLAGRT